MPGSAKGGGTASSGARRGRWWHWGVALLLLSGCQGNGPEAVFENYIQRLGRTLQVAPPRLDVADLPRPPRTGKLQLDITRDSLDAVDFLALGGCAVQVTIGKRNSSLGRMAKPSQRLLLALEYLQLAPACIDHLRRDGSAALADTLQHSWHHKRDALPALIFNATLGGQEYRTFWLASRPPGLYPPVSSSVSVRALGAINQQVQRWLDGDFQADNRGFEILLSEVAGGDGGALLKSLSQQRDWLGLADLMLAQRMERGPLCAPGIRHEAADVLPNIVQRYFIGQIQVQAARMERHRYALQPAVAALEAQLAPALPAAYQNWMNARSSHLLAAAAAPRRHVQKIKRILAPCGSSVT